MSAIVTQKKTAGESGSLGLGEPRQEALTLLRALDPDRLSPREALDLLYRLRGALDGET